MKKVELTWADMLHRAKVIAEEIWAADHRVDSFLLYPVPNGGIHAAQLVQTALTKYRTAHLTNDIKEADVIIDDIIDTGKTRLKFPQGKPFYSLIDKSRDVAPNTWVVFPWESIQKDHPAGPEDAVIRLLEYIGEDPCREGLLETPKRVLKACNDLYSGYRQDPKDLMKVFKDGSCDEMVILKDIEIQSTCEHHMLPFTGVAHVAYIPNGKVIGVSKLARVVDIFAKRLQIQERLCQQVTTALDTYLEPKGSACIIEAKHLCMVCRGVKKQNSVMITSSITGEFREIEVRQELMSLIRS